MTTSTNDKIAICDTLLFDTKSNSTTNKLIGFAKQQYKNNIFVVDEIMGTGKTTSSINYIKSISDDIINNEVNILYSVPYISEIERLQKDCLQFGVKLISPVEANTKHRNLNHLIKGGKNIITTHALINNITKDDIESLQDKNYICIMDEVINGFEEIQMSKYDIKILYPSLHKEENTNILKFNDENYNGVFNSIKSLSDEQRLCGYGEIVLYKLFPIDFFKAFNKVFILTYMFNASQLRCYFDFYKYKYNFCQINKESQMFTLQKQNRNYREIKSKIHILEKHKINNIGENKPTDLCKSWYKKATPEDITTLKNNAVNYFKNIVKGKSSANMWTTFKNYKLELTAKGYTKGFCECNKRATNEFTDKTNIAYLINLYISPVFNNFIKANGISINSEKYALNQLLQFIWRSAIRKDKDINIYIPSKRMRMLLTDWINSDIDTN